MSLRQPRKVLPGSDSQFPVAGFFGGRLRPDKGTQFPENSLRQFRKPKAGFFGGRLRPDKGTQFPENSLKQFRKPKPQILISCGWIFWWPAAQIRGRKSLKIF